MNYYYGIILFVFIIFVFKFFIKEKIILEGKFINNDFENPKNNQLNFLWSKGLKEKNEYSFKETDDLSSEKQIINQINKKVVWIRLSSNGKEKLCDLDLFSKNLNNLDHSIILITSDGDKSIPSDLKESTFNSIIKNPKILKWYTQNYDGTIKNKKLLPYPIGFDLHSTRGIKNNIGMFFTKKVMVTKKINKLLNLRKDFIDKKDKIFCDVHLSESKKFNNERRRVKKILNNFDKMEFLYSRISQEDIWDKYSSHKFVISTFGNGLDCHRTWEVLFLGGIVITKNSSLNPLYKNLPVVLVDDWDEVMVNGNLEKWEKQYYELTKPEHINKFFKYDYWIKEN